jgi:hypothetical protein
VNAADYVVLRRTLGTTVLAPYFGADGDGDMTIDQDDVNVWRANFGRTIPMPLAGSGAGAALAVAEPATELQQASHQSTSSSVPVSKPKRAAEFEVAKDKKRVSEGRVELFAALYPRTVPSRPAIRSTLDTTAAAANRSDEALLAWLEQAESKQKSSDRQEPGMWGKEALSSASSLQFDSVDQVFALMTSG